MRKDLIICYGQVVSTAAKGIEKALRLAGSGDQPFDEEIKADYFASVRFIQLILGLKL